MADRPKVPVSVTSEFPLFTLQFYENEEEEAVCHAFCDKYNLPNTVYSHLVSQVTAMHQQFLQTEEEESEWEKEDESYEEEEVEEYSEFDAPLPQKPLQQPDAGGEIINPFTPPLPPVPTKSSPQTKKTEAEIREAIERLTRQGEEIRDKREQAAREKEKNETPKTKQITEKEKTKIVNKLYEDAKRRNEEQRKKGEKRRQQEEEEAKLEKEVKRSMEKQLNETTSIIRSSLFRSDERHHTHVRNSKRTIKTITTFIAEKKFENVRTTHRDFSQESFPQLKRGTLEAQEVRTRSDHTTQISQELTEKMEKKSHNRSTLKEPRKTGKNGWTTNATRKEQSKPTFRKRIVLPSDEISPKKVTLEQNRIDSLTARLDHEAKERSKTARSDKKSHKIVEQKQRKRIDEVFLHLVSGLGEWKSENVGSPNLPDDGENHTTSQQNQETEALLNVTELRVVISLSQPSTSIRKWKNLNKPHFETSALSPTLPTRIEDASSPYFTTQNISTPKTELSIQESFEPFPQQSPLSGTGKTSFLLLASLDAVHRIRNSITF
ncbi:hypothetical protein BLNAU_18692 [Blattamonas nauphoetae]|uniref:Uncharacterized protein n=2 Tax=Blattamonas nauphoetae TaxID=2049346 RepID=A0ABQ9X6T0_9EUKA|nr:hypothetical protein BLNAU_18692 [Blattamonas nauphoetae]